MKRPSYNKINLDYHIKKDDSIKGELVSVNHICINHDSVIFKEMIIPFGSKDILEKETFIIDEIFHELVHILMDQENKNKKITICSDNPKAKRMFARKLEDKLKIELEY